MRYLLLLATCFGAAPTSVNAQPTEGKKESNSPVVELPSDVNVTPEMWMYLHEYKRHQDPKEAVRKKAEFRAQQRRARIAAQKWFGHSALRPTVRANPYFTNSYGTTWIGLPWTPSQWSGYSMNYPYYRGSGRHYYYLDDYRIARFRR